MGNLRLKLENQEKRLHMLERNSVQRNLIFFGVEENEKSYFQLQDKILYIINRTMNIKIEDFELQSVRRIGKKCSRARPISVAFTTLGKKIKILQNRKELDSTNIYLKEEFPANILKVREQLKQQQKIETDKGNIAHIRYDKLVVKPNKNETSTNKRHLSTSPETSQQGSSHTPDENTNLVKQNAQINKKYKKTKNTIMSYVVQAEDA